MNWIRKAALRCELLGNRPTEVLTEAFAKIIREEYEAAAKCPDCERGVRLACQPCPRCKGTGKVVPNA